MRKIPFAGVELTSQRVRGLRGTSELPGRPAIISGRSPALCCTLTLISMQGHQNHNPFYLRVLDYRQCSNMVLHGLKKIEVKLNYYLYIDR